MSELLKPSDTFSKRVVGAVIAFYVLLMVVLGALGFVGFVFKTMIIPNLFMVAIATRTLTPFVRDWFAFLCCTLWFDSMRGLAYVLVKRFDLPVFMNYAVTAEKALFGGSTLPEVLQQQFYTPGSIGLLETISAIVYASHFLAFFLFGLVVWYWRRAEFWQYRAVMVLVMIVGALFYVFLPTVPPWMASNVYYVLPTIYQPGREIYNLTFPIAVAVFDTNPIAAMPSLHAAFPFACAGLAVRIFGRKGLLFSAYPLAVVFAAGYLGEHYIVDLLAGALLGLGANLAPAAAPKLRRAFAGWAPAPSFSWLLADRPLIRAGLLGFAVLAVAFATSAVSTSLDVPSRMSATFVERELLGRSPMDHYFLAWVSHDAGDYEAARAQLLRSLNEIPEERKSARNWANVMLVRSAHRTGRHQEAIDAFGRIPAARLNPELAGMCAISLLETGQDIEGFSLLDDVSRRDPTNPEWPYTLARYGFLRGRSGPSEVESTIKKLEEFDTKQVVAVQYASSLRAMLSAGSL